MLGIYTDVFHASSIITYYGQSSQVLDHSKPDLNTLYCGNWYQQHILVMGFEIVSSKAFSILF
jgi:hypothetical protein